MSRASTEQHEAVMVMMNGVLNRAFDEAEVAKMFVEAVRRMTVTEMEQLVKEFTRYDDLMDVEVASM